MIAGWRPHDDHVRRPCGGGACGSRGGGRARPGGGSEGDDPRHPGGKRGSGAGANILDKDQFEELKNAVVKSYRPEPKGKEPSKFAAKEFNVGDKVRIKLNNILGTPDDVSQIGKEVAVIFQTGTVEHALGLRG